MPSLPGPAFWERAYGFQTFDEFFEAVGKYIPSVAYYGVGLTKETVAEIAWQNPASGYGNMAVLIAAYRGVLGPESSGLGAAAANASMAFQVGGLESMPQLIIPGAFQVTITGKAGGSDVCNVVGVSNGGGNAADATAAVRTAWKAASGPLANLSSLYTLDNFEGVDIGSANGSIARITDTTAGGQTASNSFATAGACALIKWNGGTRSRSARGRLYFGPLQESQINADGRTITAAFLTTINTAFSTFRSSLSSSGYPLVVLSRTLSEAFPVTSSACETVIATQRRRIR